MPNTNKFRLGLFVLGGVAALIAVMFFLGLSDLFTPRAQITTLFSESVQGLAVGSAVKYKGVPIGNVSSISIQVNDKLIRVDMEVELSAFIEVQPLQRKSPENLQSFYRFFTKERDNGLRARLEYAGITGLKYIEFDFFEQNTSTVSLEQPNDLSSEQFYLPSSPSTFNDLLGMFTTSLSRISQVDFVGISNEIKRSLSEASALISDPELKVIVQRIEGISANLERSSSALARTMTEERLRIFMDELQQSAQDINILVTNVNKQILDAKLPDTTTTFRNAAQSIDNAGKEFSVITNKSDDTIQNLNSTLAKLNEALDAMTELIQYLNNDPTAIINGKKIPQVQFNH